MKVLGIDHIGIAVSSLETALAFYREHFGLQAQAIETLDDLGLRIARLMVGDVELELIEAQDWNKTTQRHLPYKGPGVYHFGLRVADVDESVHELDAKKVRLIDNPPREGKHMRVSFIHPDATAGALIELVTRKK
ncbi:MAG TPA: VOC family protein [Candidatus Acidoferrales bacterium]|nr:VOC family protein [Candidatus Acidoferrales bacterium]